ncbi:MAG: hypothetical protein ABFC73_02375, partial [Clostridiaceae bacterium]
LFEASAIDLAGTKSVDLLGRLRKFFLADIVEILYNTLGFKSEFPRFSGYNPAGKTDSFRQSALLPEPQHCIS